MSKNDLPSVLYKYRDWCNKFDQRILTHKEIYFTSPSKFNDPYDCKIPMRYDMLSDNALFERFCDIQKKVHPEWDEGKLTKEANDFVLNCPIKDKAFFEQKTKNVFNYIDNEFGV